MAAVHSASSMLHVFRHNGGRAYAQFLNTAPLTNTIHACRDPVHRLPCQSQPRAALQDLTCTGTNVDKQPNVAPTQPWPALSTLESTSGTSSNPPSWPATSPAESAPCRHEAAYSPAASQSVLTCCTAAHSKYASGHRSLCTSQACTSLRPAAPASLPRPRLAALHDASADHSAEVTCARGTDQRANGFALSSATLCCGTITEPP